MLNIQVDIIDGHQDPETWFRLMTRLPSHVQDVYFTPNYVRLHLFEPGSKAILFSCVQGENIWLYPFVLQPILRVGEQLLQEELYDIEAAYGYGGPLSNSCDRDFIDETHALFQAWCRTQGVVAEFVRLHPLIGNQVWLAPNFDIILDRETASLDLDALSAERLPFSSTARNKLRRAERAGIRVETSPDIEVGFALFVELYRKTMDRLEADEYYYFNDLYFENLRNLVRDTGRLLVVKREDEVLASSIFLQGTTCLHYHLSGTNPDQPFPGVVNMLVYEAARWGQQQGLKCLHLGGGRTASSDDSLFKFKQTMATSTHAFYIGKRIHDSVAYQNLCESWKMAYPELVPRYGNRLLCYRQTRETPRHRLTSAGKPSSC